MSNGIVDLPGQKWQGSSSVLAGCFAKCIANTSSPNLPCLLPPRQVTGTTRADTSPDPMTQATGSVVPSMPSNRTCSNKHQNLTSPFQQPERKARFHQAPASGTAQEMPDAYARCAALWYRCRTWLASRPSNKTASASTSPTALHALYSSQAGSVPAPVPVPNCRETHAAEGVEEEKKEKSRKAGI